MNNIAFIIPTFFIISCANPSINVEKEEAAIYSVLIDKMATPFPPPPPPPKDGSYIKPINMDSINKIKVEVVIDTVMLHVRRSFKLDKQFNEYQALVNDLSSLSVKPLKIDYINSKKGHKLIFGNSLDDSDTRYSQKIGFSRVSFNKEKTMAAVYAGRSTHPLASYLDLYLLEKKEGKWHIIYEKNILVS